MRYDKRSSQAAQKRDRKSRKHSAWPLAASAVLGRRLRVEPLESRQLLSAVSWDGGGDGTNWSDPINWSGNALPGAADDVTINVVGLITVTHASGNTIIRSLTSAENLVISGGSFQVTNGASTVSASFTIGSGANLTANGPTATFTASGATTIDGANLFASAGGQLNLSLATSYAEIPFNVTQFIANGAGSQIDLSGVTSMTGTNGGVNVYAQAGGTVKLPALASTTATGLHFQADGAASVLNLTALTSVNDASLQGSLTLANGGTLTAPVFATYSGGNIVVTNMTASLPTLTNIDRSYLFANANGILTLAGVTSYAEAAFNVTQFSANGANAKIDLPNLTSMTGTNGAVNVYAQTGGTVKLSALASTTATGLHFLADGATSVLNLTALTSVNDASLQGSLTLANGGTLTAPVLATYSGGSIVVTNMTVSLPTLTNIDRSSLYANANGILTLAGITSYAEAAFNVTQFLANGANAKIDVPNLTSMTGTNGAVNIYAQAGGTVKLSALASTTAVGLHFLADGATSVLNLTALTSVNDPASQGLLTLANGATLTAPVFATYSGGNIVVTNMTASLPTLTNIDRSSLTANANGILTLAGVTSYAEGAFSVTQFSASGANAKIDVPNLTSLTGTNGAVNIYAQAGGTVKLSALASTTAVGLHFLADGATSVLNLTALTSVNDPASQGLLTLANGGTLTAPVFATYSGGNIVVTNMTASLPTLTNIDRSSLTANANGILTLTGVTSYAEGAFSVTQFSASGANAKIDVPNLTSLTGTNGAVNVYAQTGGTVKLSGLTSTTAVGLHFLADGASSVLNLTGLTTVNDPNQQSSLVVANGGTANLTPATANFTGVFLTANSAGVISGATIQLNSPGTLIGNGGTVQGNFINPSSVLPGVSPTFLGTINFSGSYSQTAAGNYSVNLNGLTPVTQYDQISVQGTVTLGGTLTITRGFTPAIGDSFKIIDNDGVDAVVGTFADSPEGDIYTINTIPFRLSYVGGDGNDVTLTRVDNLNVRRLLFYNQSGTSTRYDNNDPAINAADDLAIASDKSAYLPGVGQATFANVSSYTKGINGVMVDLAGPHGALSLSDFVFRVGNNNSPSTWATANAPTSMSVRAGAGYRGADRIEFVWTTGAPFKQWLEVITLANGTTNMPQKAGYPAGQGDVFFFGNAPGNTGTGDTASNSLVNSLDEAAIRANNALVSANIPITNVYDVGRNASVNVVDESAARLNGTNPATALKYLNLASPPLAPESDDGAIASALVATSSPAGVTTAATLDSPVAGTNCESFSGGLKVASQLMHWAHGTTPRGRAILAALDSAFDSADLDDDWFSAFADRWKSGP